jgi:hypothetical protein
MFLIGWSVTGNLPVVFGRPESGHQQSSKQLCKQRGGVCSVVSGAERMRALNPRCPR